MFSDPAAMDAALALGPVRIECNVCGKYHDVALDASAIAAAVGSREWDGVRWLDCMAQRCALGLHWSQKNTSAAMLRICLKELQALYCAEEGQRKTIRFVYETCPEAFAGSSFHGVRDAIGSVLTLNPYECMLRSRDDVSAVKGRVLRWLICGYGTFPVRMPWMLAVDARIANRYMARDRIEALLAANGWPAILAGARGLAEATPRVCAVPRESGGFVASVEPVWKAFAASNAVLALHEQLASEFSTRA